MENGCWKLICGAPTISQGYGTDWTSLLLTVPKTTLKRWNKRMNPMHSTKDRSHPYLKFPFPSITLLEVHICNMYVNKCKQRQIIKPNPQPT